MASTTNFTLEIPTPGGYRNTWGGTLNTTITKLDELMALAMPIGTIQMYPLATAPTSTSNGGEWLICNGGSLAQAGVYAPLFALIGTTYGTGAAASGTFSLPDMRARVPVGYNTDDLSSVTNGERSTNAINNTVKGAENHTLLDAEIPKHIHPITDPGHIHPVTDVSHFHVGDQTGGKTGSKTLVITDPQHGHTLETVKSWGDHDYYRPEWGPGPELVDVTTALASTGITIADHDHSLTTDTKPTGITTTTTNTARITTTDEQSITEVSHNNMQPYLVVQYIILAKHPTF